MENDDVQVGRVLNRREALSLLGVGGAAVLGVPSPTGGAASPPFRLPRCIVRPSQTEGPYFFDSMLERSDIRSDPEDGSIRPGVPLRLEFRVSRINSAVCEPLPDAVVDVWQCDAMGIYSGVEDIGGQYDTTGRRFLRGYQVTDEHGSAHFQTVYPGWYRGRAVHVHFKIRTNPSGDAGHELTSQLYFDDALNDRVLTAHPYAAHEGPPPRNADDRIFRSGGEQLVLDVVEEREGFSAVFDVGLQIG